MMHRPRAGFSLIELIIVIGLIAILGGLVVTNSTAILRGIGERSIQDSLRLAVREARYQAAFQKDTVFLRFDSQQSRFLVESSTGQQLKEFQTSHEPDDSRLDLRFYQLLPQQGVRFARTAERVEIDAPRFRPDRSSTPFEVHIRVDNELSVHRYDPFSDIELSANR